MRVWDWRGPGQWRAMMGGGAWWRWRGRAGALVRYPLRVAWWARRRDVGGLVVTTNPFILPLVVLLAKPVHRKPVVVLQYDLFPDALHAAAGGRPGVAVRALSVLMAAANRVVFSRADAVVFIGERMAKHATERYGEPRRKAVIPTGASVAEMSDGADGSRATTTIISYVGNLGAMHDWRTLADALPGLVERTRDAPAWELVVAASGAGLAAFRTWLEVASPEVREHVRLEPPMDDAAWRRLMQQSAVSLVTLRAEAALVSFPSKALSAMAAGAAVVAVAPAGSDLADLVQRHECGWVVEPGDAAGLAIALEAAVVDATQATQFGQNGRRAVEEAYDVEVLVERWLAVLREVEAISSGGDKHQSMPDGRQVNR